MFSYNYAEPTAKSLFENAMPVVRRVSFSGEDPSWSYALHVHQNYAEILFIVNGTAQVTVSSKANEVHAGDVIVILPGLVHGLSSSKKDPSLIFCCGLEGVDPHILPGGICPITSSGEYLQAFQNIADTLYRLVTHDAEVNQTVCSLLGASLAAMCYQLFCNVKTEYPYSDKSFARDVLIYIDEHYQHKHTLQSLAAAFYVSPGHLSNEFKRIYGISPINYLIDRRICEARWQLINTKMPIRQIAENIGYDNPYYFAKLFHTRTGTFPDDYRKQYEFIN